MNYALLRLLQLANQPEGVGTGEGGDDKSKPNGKVPPQRAAVDDEDDDEDVELRQPSPYEVQLRAENKKRRLETKELTKKLADQEASTAKAIADAVKAAQEQAKKDRDDEFAERDKKANERVIRAEIKAALKAANVADEETGLKMIDASGISVNEAGDVVGVQEAITKLKTDKAFLFSNGSTTDTSSKAPTPKPVEVKAVKDMNKQEYDAYKKSVGVSTRR